MPLQPGELVGRYRIRSLLGAGGMGAVYLADDELLRREVALKVALERFPDHFLQEARAAAALTHPHICTLFDLGPNFLVMEYVEGETLRQRVNRGPVAIDEAVQIAREISSALETAHARGVVHLDLKPSNIMLTSRGAKLLDFGIARRRRVAASSPRETTETQFAESIGGTPEYMAPEQARGNMVDGRTDLFSLGVVLYEMVGGAAPFAGASVADVIAAVLTREPPPLSQLRPETPQPLAQLVKRLLSKDSAQRPQTAAEVTRALEQIAAPAPPLPLARRRFGIAVMAGGVVTILGLGWAAASRWNPLERKRQPSALRVIRLTNSGLALHGAVSPDGKYLAYTVADGQMHSLWVREISGVANTALTRPAARPFWGLTFSSDGRFVYYTQKVDSDPNRSAIYKISVIGGEPREIVPNVVSGVSISPDGTRLAYHQTAGASGDISLMICSNEGENQREIWRRKSFTFLPEHTPGFSPDGRRLASVRPSEAGIYAVLASVGVDGRGGKVHSPKPLFNVQQVIWPEGNRMLVVAQDRATTFSPQLQWIEGVEEAGVGRVQRLTDQSDDYLNASFDRSGTTLVSAQRRNVAHIWIAPVGARTEATKIDSMIGHADGKYGIAWLDNTRLAYSSDVNGESVILTGNRDGSGQRLLGPPGGGDYDPAATPDGRYVLFASLRGGSTGRRIWRMDSSGANLTQLTSGPMDWLPRSSPDSRFVYYGSLSGGVRSIWRVPIEGGAAEPLTDRLSNHPDPSPDGNSVACLWAQSPGARLQLAIFPTRGGSPRRLDLPPTAELLMSSLRWTPDGQAVAYVDTRNGVSNIWAMTLDGASPRQLTFFGSELIYKFAFSPDGRSLACSRGNSSNDIVMLKEF